MIRHPSEIRRAGIRVDVSIPEQYQLCDRCEKQSGDYRAPAPTPIATEEQCMKWNRYLEKWYLRYPCDTKMTAYLDENKHLRISFVYHDEPDASDLEGKIRIAEITSGGLLAPSILPDAETPRWIRSNILYHLNHELDEHLQFDGERVFDPHVTAVYHCERCVSR